MFVFDENHFRKCFPKMRLFGWSGKFYFPEIEIRWPEKKAFDHGNAFTLLFFLQSISGKWEREGESARARARGEDPVRDHELQLQSEIAIAIQDRDWRCDLAKARSRSSRDRAVDRAVVELETFSSLMIFFFWVVACVFWFVFSFFFSKHQKIFSGKFFEMQPNTWKYFPFPEISISGKYVFSGKHFTATKHSLQFPQAHTLPAFSFFFLIHPHIGIAKLN